MARRAPYERYKREDVKLVGVTFDNRAEDGSGNRQDNLSKLQGEPSKVRLEHTVYHDPETGENEPAIRVRSLRTYKILGYIPRNRINDFWNDKEMVLQVTHHKATYGGILTRPEKPSAKQYGTVMGMKRQGKLNNMPLYDKTAYQWALSQCLAQH